MGQFGSDAASARAAFLARRQLIEVGVGSGGKIGVHEFRCNHKSDVSGALRGF